MDIDIRRAALRDDILLSHLSMITFLDTFRGTCTDDDINGFVDRCFNVEQVKNELQNPLDFYFIAFIDNQAVGYLRMKEDESDVPVIRQYHSIELKRLYVLKEYHDKKVGAALMRFALQFATDKGYKAVWLGVWEHNERAKAFYERWGYTYTGFMHDFPIGGTPQTDQWYIKVLTT